MTRGLLSGTDSPSLGLVAGLALAVFVGATVAPALAATGQTAGDVRPGATLRANLTAQADGTTDLPRQRLRRLVHRYVNRERVERGLDPLALDGTLSRVARYHSRDMARNDYFAHVSPSGETRLDRYERFGVDCRVPLDGNYSTGGENIRYTYYETPVEVGDRTVTYSTPDQLARGIVDRWMASKDHRRNILRPYWRREGIGFAAEETSVGTRVYVTQNFC